MGSNNGLRVFKTKGSNQNSEPTCLSACLSAWSMGYLRSGKGWLMRGEAAFCAAFHASFLGQVGALCAHCADTMKPSHG